MGANKCILVVLLVAVCLIGESRSLTRREINVCRGGIVRLRWLHKETGMLRWDRSLAEKAQAYAEKLVEINKQSNDVKLPHSETPGVGENLYWREGEDAATCAHATLKWYSEITNYNFATTGSSDNKPNGHFTQLVWKNTKSFGLGIATMQARGLGKLYGYVETFIVAMFSPSGNVYIKGERKKAYLANVKPRKQNCIGFSCVPGIWVLDPKICVDRNGPATCRRMIQMYGCSGEGRGSNINQRKTKRECKKSCGKC